MVVFSKFLVAWDATIVVDLNYASVWTTDSPTFLFVLGPVLFLFLHVILCPMAAAPGPRCLWPENQGPCTTNGDQQLSLLHLKNNTQIQIETWPVTADKCCSIQLGE